MPGMRPSARNQARVARCRLLPLTAPPATAGHSLPCPQPLMAPLTADPQPLVPRRLTRSRSLLTTQPAARRSRPSPPSVQPLIARRPARRPARSRKLLAAPPAAGQRPSLQPLMTPLATVRRSALRRSLLRPLPLTRRSTPHLQPLMARCPARSLSSLTTPPASTGCSPAGPQPLINLPPTASLGPKPLVARRPTRSHSLLDAPPTTTQHSSPQSSLQPPPPPPLVTSPTAARHSPPRPLPLVAPTAKDGPSPPCPPPLIAPPAATHHSPPRPPPLIAHHPTRHSTHSCSVLVAPPAAAGRSPPHPSLCPPALLASTTTIHHSSLHHSPTCPLPLAGPGGGTERWSMHLMATGQGAAPVVTFMVPGLLLYRIQALNN